jgi:hypothetical protein
LVSGAAVKAMLAASTNMSEQLIGAAGAMYLSANNDDIVATNRSSVVLITGTPTVLGNQQQGFGRVIMSQVLPLVNWPNTGVPPDGLLTLDTIEKPALGLLVFEHGLDTNGVAGGLGEGLPVFSGPPATEQTHTFRVLGTAGEIRACLAYPDPAGNTLVNDLDLELVSPTGKTYDGNVYSNASQQAGQWNQERRAFPFCAIDGGLNAAGLCAVNADCNNGITPAPPDACVTVSDPGDTRNPLECVHLHDDPDNNPIGPADNQIQAGIWTVRVKYGIGGSAPGSISLINGANEDANGNNRLDGGEDTDADTRLDKGGQPYAVVVSGPVVASKDGGQNAPHFADYPQSIMRLNNGIRYSCSDDVIVQIWDNDASASTLGTFVTARVLNTAGAVVDTEGALTFTGSGAPFVSGPMPVRQGTTGTPGNGVLEGDTNYTIEMTYADPTGSSRTIKAWAPMNCEAHLLTGSFGNPEGRNRADLVFGGCDGDQSFDENELVTYSVAVVNYDLYDQYTDVTATLRACAVPFVNGSCGTASTVLTILDNPKNIGRLPVGQAEAVTFSIQVSSTPLAQGPKVYLRLDLDSTHGAKNLSALGFEFTHPVGSDRAILHYSTDYKTGSGVITRDLNRTFAIEPNDRPGLTQGFLDETITFSNLFTPEAGHRGCNVTTTRDCLQNSDCPVGETCTFVANGAINNVVCTGAGAPSAGCVAADEAYPALGILNPGVGDGTLDRHVLAGVAPAAADRIPWNFDQNNGGFYAARDASSVVAGAGTSPVWHYVTSGACGFQTQSKSNCVLSPGGDPGNDPDGFGGAPCAALTAGLGTFVGGVWHTGSGVLGVCTGPGPDTTCYLTSDCVAGDTCVGGADNGVNAGGYADCGNYGVSVNASTPERAEYLHDYLVSPIIEQVNQGLDANGFEYEVEFQRLGFNNSVQIRYASVGAYVNIDNNVDSNNNNAIIRPGVFRGDGLPYYIAFIGGPIDPVKTELYYNMTTFANRSETIAGSKGWTDPDQSLTECTVDVNPLNTACVTDADCQGVDPTSVCGYLSGDETGFTGFDRTSTNPNAVKPALPVAPANLRPYPASGDVLAVGSEDTVAGPSRNFDVDMVNYEDGVIQFFTPGDAGNRWQIGISMLTVEHAENSET